MSEASYIIATWRCPVCRSQEWRAYRKADKEWSIGSRICEICGNLAVRVGFEEVAAKQKERPAP